LQWRGMKNRSEKKKRRERHTPKGSIIINDEAMKQCNNDHNDQQSSTISSIYLSPIINLYHPKQYLKSVTLITHRYLSL
jgi:hypothetical protein